MSIKPSKERPWMKYYPSALIDGLSDPECTLNEYLRQNCPGEDVTAIHYYGNDISWKELFFQAESVARALRAIGFGEGDTIPVFLKAVPEFVYLLLAAERIGASLLCRDNTVEENVDAVCKAKATVIFAHDFLSQQEFNQFRSVAGVDLAILLPPIKNISERGVPEHIRRYVGLQYQEYPAYGPQTLTWDCFLEQGKQFEGTVEASRNINRPLFKAYTSGATGPSKQVIHSAHSIIGNIHQMNFYGSNDNFRPSWLVTHFPTALVAVVVAMMLMPLASNKLLILDPFCSDGDADLEMMRYRPNCWPLIPMFVETIMRSSRVPEDYDLSHLLSAGAGCEALNNKQFKTVQAFLKKHNCGIRFTSGYGSSESGSNMTLPMTPHPMGNGNVGIPMPLSVMGIFEPGTTNELGYNQPGEICLSSPANMLGYDNPKATELALQKHDDGLTWLHTGDIGYMNEDGVIFVMTRGKSPRYDGGDLASLPMENAVADLEIDGIKDEFYVIVPDGEHPGCFLPYLFIQLEKGYTLEHVAQEIKSKLDHTTCPVEIFEIKERPFFHFKTNRLALSKMISEGVTDFSNV
ncbi:class I adenylate-forming enzyme family protein [Proteiniclasticum sp. QWL-01]|uniref:AMP-binding protein n=1 Tax=Proteiniclasticum sp. QWL-01 TaxID=3036945 RepID=UPI0024114110|nr:class I adenylate-forming enzyme family protein [Proteiniclasticum sp. QWL-01]WFF73248.1 class I adenylate-forming enzyme family protein [Proteiniclasticum sp. QWL-01]